MNTLLFKKTTDADLSKGTKVAFMDISGQFTHVGIITCVSTLFGSLVYELDNGYGVYTADELKLVLVPVIEGLEEIASDTNLIYNKQFVDDAVNEMRLQGFHNCHKPNTQDFSFLKMLIKAIQAIRDTDIDQWLANTTAGTRIKEVICKLMHYCFAA